MRQILRTTTGHQQNIYRGLAWQGLDQIDEFASRTSFIPHFSFYRVYKAQYRY